MNSTPLVLLVEDDLRLAELVQTYLHNNGFRVVVEHRGDRVVEHLQNDAPDLVVLDLGLPGRDGFAVCKELRTASDLPILIVTARDNDIDHVVGLELGADDYVVKPVEPRVLVARIHALQPRIPSRRLRRVDRVSLPPPSGTRAVQMPPSSSWRS